MKIKIGNTFEDRDGKKKERFKLFPVLWSFAVECGSIFMLCWQGRELQKKKNVSITPLEFHSQRNHLFASGWSFFISSNPPLHFLKFITLCIDQKENTFYIIGLKTRHTCVHFVFLSKNRKATKHRMKQTLTHSQLFVVSQSCATIMGIPKHWLVWSTYVVWRRNKPYTT